jgi:hypothetical protein
MSQDCIELTQVGGQPANVKSVHSSAGVVDCSLVCSTIGGHDDLCEQRVELGWWAPPGVPGAIDANARA